MTTTQRPAEVFPPGEYLRDELEERGWTVTDLARIIDRPIQAISEILNGKKEITTETAIDLGDALGTSPEVWLNLQVAYRLHNARSAKGPSLVQRRGRLRSFGPIAEMQRRGWLSETDDVDILEEEVATMFHVETLDAEPAFVVAARRSNAADGLTATQQAWLARVRSVATEHSVTKLDLKALRALAASIPERFMAGAHDLPQLSALLAECGVVFVFEPALKGSKLDGAVVFTPSGVPAIGLTGRYDRLDILLFTLLHECAHLTLRHVTASTGPVMDEELEAGSAPEGIEHEANEQASEWLFPSGFVAPSRPVSAATVVALAREHHVHPSVVIGRLQREGLLEYYQFRTHLQKVTPYFGAVSR